MARLPKRLAHLPETPVNGNYVMSGRFTWAHAESLSEVWAVWRGGHGGTLNGTGPYGRRDLAIVDTTDDFRISHLDGGVVATKVVLVYQQDDKGKVVEARQG